jgi:hypothetical protein
MDGSAAQSIYRLEKERAMQERRLSHTALMAEAKEAFAKLLADAQLARKGGRPRTNPLPPGAMNRPPVKPPVAVAAPVVEVKAAAPAKVAAKPAKKAVAKAKPAKAVAKAGAKAGKSAHKAASKKAKPAAHPAKKSKKGR